VPADSRKIELCVSEPVHLGRLLREERRWRCFPLSNGIPRPVSGILVLRLGGLGGASTPYPGTNSVFQADASDTSITPVGQIRVRHPRDKAVLGPCKIVTRI